MPDKKEKCKIIYSENLKHYMLCTPKGEVLPWQLDCTIEDNLGEPITATVRLEVEPINIVNAELTKKEIFLKADLTVDNALR